MSVSYAVSQDLDFRVVLFALTRLPAYLVSWVPALFVVLGMVSKASVLVAVIVGCVAVAAMYPAVIVGAFGVWVALMVSKPQ